MQIAVGTSIIEVAQGDITRETVDAIVNAANETLLGGGGVDGAIHRAGGPAILEECRKLGGCKTGDAKITTAGKMPAQYVIHTVGPVYRDGAHGEPEKLASCYRRSLEVALANGVKTISFPAISCGVYGYPIPDAAAIAMQTVKEFLETHPGIDRVRFVLFGQGTYGPFEAALKKA
ncbi:MAG TPA: O-acetyl-ADP-ribose deacetylase [Candidatus Hydrogenedentes bacterium]|nr:O-acetyl-ADP-ribose deacetylase [Candidatus Hydrogenedentota bacterium]